MGFEDGLLLLQERARLMAQAAEKEQGAMAAVLGMDEKAVESLCADAGADVCNLNLPSQTVIGGRADAVQRAAALARERGAQRVLELNVGGAFHSRLMLPAREGLVRAVANAPLRAPRVPIVSNATARPLTDEAEIREELIVQVASPVRWHETISLMAASGVASFMEFGPGKVLTGMAKRLVPEARLVNISRSQDLLHDDAVAGRPR
jgi:[acyl-carrier-protein] S-malonyltransferase